MKNTANAVLFKPDIKNFFNNAFLNEVKNGKNSMRV
jgi:hypothetical protein